MKPVQTAAHHDDRRETLVPLILGVTVIEEIAVKTSTGKMKEKHKTVQSIHQ